MDGVDLSRAGLDLVVSVGLCILNVEIGFVPCCFETSSLVELKVGLRLLVMCLRCDGVELGFDLVNTVFGADNVSLIFPFPGAMSLLIVAIY